jgi:hypothetical protein
LRTRAFTVFHADGSVTRIMVTEKRLSPRVLVKMRVEIAGPSTEEASSLSVAELESLVAGLRELAADYETISRDRAADRRGS